jgi:uncharacterized protein YpmS
MEKPIKKSFVSNDKSESSQSSQSSETTKQCNSEVDIYIENFNPLEKIAYEIAKSRLKTSFDIEKSIGYVKK